MTNAVKDKKDLFPEDLETHLIHIARSYAVKMNEIEIRIFEIYENDKTGLTESFAAYKAQYDPVFQQYATSKRRVYGGQANSYGRPAKYDGITTETAARATVKSKSKAEVYFQTDNQFSAEYLFVLHKEGEEWKIDNVKYKWYNNEKWSPLIM